MIDPAITQLARQTLSPKQLQAWEHIHLHRMSLRGAATHLGIHRTTFVDRYDAACLNLKRVGILIDASGQPYLEETTAA